MKQLRYFLFFAFFLLQHISFAQKTVVRADSTRNNKISKHIITGVDSLHQKYNPAIAIRRSAMLPGWGQYTNKKYWKIPIVYGALGTTTALFFHNLNQYKDARNAYKLATDGDASNDNLIKQPYFTLKDQPDRIKSFRNEVRQNVDYCVLFFVIFYGLNVADAAVDAHLKTFDVSDNLSMEFKPGHSSMANTDGLSLVLHIGK